MSTNNPFRDSTNIPASPTTGVPPNFSQEIGLLEKEFQSTLSDLKWAEQRIRILEVKIVLENFYSIFFL